MATSQVPKVVADLGLGPEDTISDDAADIDSLLAELRGAAAGNGASTPPPSPEPTPGNHAATPSTPQVPPTPPPGQVASPEPNGNAVPPQPAPGPQPAPAVPDVAAARVEPPQPEPQAVPPQPSPAPQPQPQPQAAQPVAAPPQPSSAPQPAPGAPPPASRAERTSQPEMFPNVPTGVTGPGHVAEVMGARSMPTVQRSTSMRPGSDVMTISEDVRRTGEITSIRARASRTGVTPVDEHSTVTSAPRRQPSVMGPLDPPAGQLRLGPLVGYLMIAGVFMVGSAIGGLAFAGTQPEVYGAETEIIYELDGNLAAGFLREDRRLTTQVATIESRAVLSPAAEQLRMDVEDLIEVIDASVVDGSELITISSEGDTPVEAKERLDTVVTIYLDRLAATDSSNDALALIEQELASVTQREQALNDELAALTAPVETTAPPRGVTTATPTTNPRVPILISELDSTRNRRIALEEQVAEQKLTDLVKPEFRVLTPSYVLEDPVSPKPLQMAAIGAIIGLLAATAVVFALERRKPRLR